jgi:cellulose biosynthesis protein BcsQ
MKKVAVANLKGGVGKSTSTLFLSECISLYHKKRVLVIDLDPQSNSSLMFLSRSGVNEAEACEKTFFHFLSSYDNGAGQTLSKFIKVNASDLFEIRRLGENARLDLLPSAPKMWIYETEFDRSCYKADLEPADRLSAFLENKLIQLKEAYDVVIFDCPPGFSTLTRTGIRLADVIVSPTIPDEVSVRSLADFTEIGMRQILRLEAKTKHCVIVSLMQKNSTTRIMLNRLREKYTLIEPPIGYSIDIIRALERIRQNSMRKFNEKYRAKGATVRRLAAHVHDFVFA